MSEIRRCAWADSHTLLRDYHDQEYRRRGDLTDRELFELLTLEMFRS